MGHGAVFRGGGDERLPALSPPPPPAPPVHCDGTTADPRAARSTGAVRPLRYVGGICWSSVHQFAHDQCKLVVGHLNTPAEFRESLEGEGGGYPPPSPPPHRPDSTPKAFPYPSSIPQPHFQPPVTAPPPPNRFHIPRDRSATAVGRPRWPPSPSSKGLPQTGSA